MSNSVRNTDLSKIHIAKKQLGMDDDTYRDMLWTISRVRSASNLDDAGRKKVLDHLRACGAKFTRKGRTTPANARAGLISKIKAQLGAAKRQDAYADGMAKRMFHVDRYEWCDEAQLRKMIAALTYDAKRHGRN
ncbi:gp16 family protein [Sulfuriflexus mobilis]|uniref:gp16 family protein n=1 Tax=Sulfuriflexus mobilis TaxID=1811807 RepID=UPI000F83B95A|nr:regulatory protein GemA [Sulfuriflexus mobilis]